MKNLLNSILAGVFMLTFSVAATAQDVPQEVKDAFAVKYGQATDVKWETNDDEKDEQGYEVEFSLNGKTLEANYTAKGVWLYTQKDIKQNALPETLKSVLQSRYSDLNIEEVAIIETPEGVRYKIGADAGDEDRELLFHEDGTKLKDSTEQEDDDGWFS